jgi:hypothetical protein
MKQQFSKLIFFSIFISNIFVFSQIPIELNHRSSIILKRLSARGEISLSYFGNNSISSIDAYQILKKNDNKIYINSLLNIRIPYKKAPHESLKQKSSIQGFYDKIFKSNLDIENKYFYQTISDTILMWIKLREVLLRESQNNQQNFQYRDEISFNGVFNNQLYISSKFSMFRHSGNKIFISNNYKNEWKKYFPEINMTFWYSNATSLYLKNSIVDIEIANNPFSWGWSSGNSPIISAKATPFNHIRLYKKFGNFNLEYFHGNILDKSIEHIHNENIKREKFISGHRVKYEINDNIQASISELVIYGNRSPELGYINPISFFWAQEHNLGDLDNILIATDVAIRAAPGFILYNSILIDELSWNDIFKNWWGNKFSYQIGMYLCFEEIKIPDFRIEYTITRPWTYTHPDFSYTNREITLGSPYGPSSSAIAMESFYMPSTKLSIKAHLEHVQKGIGLGSNILDNYDNRDKNMDWNTNLLLSNHYTKTTLQISVAYVLSNYLKLQTIFSSNYFNKNELNKNGVNSNKLLLGLELEW